MDWLVWALKRSCWWDVSEFDYIYPLWRRVEFVSTNQISGSLKARIFVWLCSFWFFVCALLAYILLLTFSCLREICWAIFVTSSFACFLLFLVVLFPHWLGQIYFVMIYLYVIHSRREDSLTRKTKPDFYVGITKNSVDCLNAGNLFLITIGTNSHFSCHRWMTVSPQWSGYPGYTSRSLIWLPLCKPPVVRTAGPWIGPHCTPQLRNTRPQRRSPRGHILAALWVDYTWKVPLGT